MVERPSLAVPKDIMDEVAKREFSKLTVPPDATQKGTGQKVAYTWIEQLQVEDIEVKEDEKSPETVIIQARYRVPDDSEYPTNIGMSHVEWYRIDNAALAAGDAKAGRHIMSTISIGKLKNLIRACGNEVPKGESVDFGDYLYEGPNGEPPVVVGARFYGRLKDKATTDRDGAPTRQTEIARFASADEVGSL